MSTFRLFIITASCVLALALFALAGDRLLTFLNVDLIATLLRAIPIARPLETNEAAVLGQARLLAAGGALALVVAMLLGFYHVLHRNDALDDRQRRLAKTLHEQELVLVAHYHDMAAQLARSRDTLAADMAEVGSSTQHMRDALEVRYASVEASLKRMDDTLVARLESLSAQVSAALESSGGQWLTDQTEASRAIAERLDAIDQRLDQRFERIDERLQSTRDDLGARDIELGNQIAQASTRDSGLQELQQQVRGVQALGERISDRIVAVESLLLASGERMGSQLTDLSRRMHAQSVNNSTYGDINTQPAQLNGTNGSNGPVGLAGSNSELQSVILNLAHLQVDLRAERSALRKRLRDMPAAPRA